MGQAWAKGLPCTPTYTPCREYTLALPRGGTVTLREMHSDVQKAGTTCLRSHSQQRRVQILTSSHPLQGPFCSLNCFPGLPKAHLLPQVYNSGGCSWQGAPSPQNAHRKEQRATSLAHFHYQGCKEVSSSNKLALGVLYCTPCWGWGHRGDQNRVPALGHLLRRN